MAAVKLVVLYTTPDDPDTFEAHYRDVHLPLVEDLPGLQSAESGRVSSALDRDPVTLYRTAVLAFANADAMKAAFRSPAGRALGGDYASIAPAGSRQYVVEAD